MSRISDLTFQLLDGAISDAERRELERLIAADKAAAREHIALMDLEGVLRADQPVDVTRETMQRIADVAGSKTGQRVVDRIRQQPRPAWKKASGIQKPVTGTNERVSGVQPKVSARRGRARRATPASFAPWMGIAAAVVLVVSVGFYFVRQPKSMVTFFVAHITNLNADARIVREGKAIVVSPGDALFSLDEVDVGSGELSIQFEDGSNVVFASKTSATLGEPSEKAAEQIDLRKGSLTAHVAKQGKKTFILTTPHATATVLGTVLQLAVDAGSTRLDVNEGSVRIERSSDKRSVVVDGGFFAVASAEQDLVARKIGSDSLITPLERVIPPETVPQPPAFGIVAFHLVDTATSQPIRGFSPLEDGAVLELRTLPKGLTLTVVTNPKEVPKIVFDVDGKKHFKDEVDPPYSLSVNWIDKDTGQDRFNPWTLGVGKHTVTATLYDSTKPNAKAGASLTVRFEIVK